MSNSIWNKYDIKDMPDENKLVVLVDKHDGFYNACFVDKTDWANDWYNHIEKWCYVDDLIAQADKAERLEEALTKIATASVRDKVSTLIDVACMALNPELDEINN